MPEVSWSWSENIESQSRDVGTTFIRVTKFGDVDVVVNIVPDGDSENWTQLIWSLRKGTWVLNRMSGQNDFLVLETEKFIEEDLIDESYSIEHWSDQRHIDELKDDNSGSIGLLFEGSA